ncbi:hypothetical protein QJS66_06735 [Kocuria rhizophila]|nr:hypothetical protein QJS66_06735 [Kocuria rhizophila]
MEKCELKGTGRTRTLQVAVDLPDGTDTLSLTGWPPWRRRISDALDRADPCPAAPYELEVSSPGATRSLERRRAGAARTVGHLVPVRPLEGERFTARLLRLHDDRAVVQRSRQPRGHARQAAGPGRVDYASIRGGEVRGGDEAGPGDVASPTTDSRRETHAAAHRTHPCGALFGSRPRSAGQPRGARGRPDTWTSTSAPATAGARAGHPPWTC